MLRAALLAPAAVLALAAAGSSPASPPLLRYETHLVPDAKLRPHPLLMTLGGPIYCMQLRNLARELQASLLCADYGRNRYTTPGGRAGRLEDWGDPAYDAAAAKLPARLERAGVRVSALILVGVSYSGYANAELVATHPELRPAALVVVDSYLDLARRFAVIPAYHETRREIVTAVGGTPQDVPQAYDERSPSHHLDGLAAAIRGGMRFVDVWSVGAEEQREFHGATCSAGANARWLAALATRLGRPVAGWVTELRHAHALWHHGRKLLALAGSGEPAPPPPTARAVTFLPGRPPPPGSWCQ